VPISRGPRRNCESAMTKFLSVDIKQRGERGERGAGVEKFVVTGAKEALRG
jgi:hypothetical protein